MRGKEERWWRCQAPLNWHFGGTPFCRRDDWRVAQVTGGGGRDIVGGTLALFVELSPRGSAGARAGEHAASDGVLRPGHKPARRTLSARRRRRRKERTAGRPGNGLEKKIV